MPARPSALLLLASLVVAACRGPEPAGSVAGPGGPLPSAAAQALPPPARSGGVSVEAALARRRSVRTFDARELSWASLGQLLWAAQGATDPAGGRAAPSAGALYPLEVVVVRADGVFVYDPAAHAVRSHRSGDARAALAAAALGQAPVGGAPAVLVLSAVVARTAKKYGARAERYAALEAGHAAQNVLLQATALGLGGVPIGGFEDEKVREVLALPPDWTPLYLIPVGYPAP